MRVVAGELEAPVDEALARRELEPVGQPVALALLVADDEKDVRARHELKLVQV